MVILGVDAHQATHTLVAADANGRQVGLARWRRLGRPSRGVALGGWVRRPDLGVGDPHVERSLMVIRSSAATARV